MCVLTVILPHVFHQHCISLYRRGTFGVLTVRYAVDQISIATLATDGGVPATNYFATVPSTNLLAELVYSSTATTTRSPLMECAEVCLSDRSCRSFNVDEMVPPNCRLSSSTSAAGTTQPGAEVYDKLLTRVSWEFGLPLQFYI